VEILKQGLHSPLKVEQQIAIIYCGSKGLLSNVPVEKVKEFESQFLEMLEMKHKDILESLSAGKLTDEVTSTLESLAKELSATFA
jgi:F-type H+-transporting ATPase subunit alpha